jgi:hypothetical protein
VTVSGAEETALAAALQAVTHPRVDVGSRRQPSVPVKVAVHDRDSWTCRYCGIRTIAPPVMQFLSKIYPAEFPHHPNWKAGQVHPAYLVLSTSLDHRLPGARGGDWVDPSNLVTSCWACNTGKADLLLEEIGWELLDVADVASEWDGLTGAARDLWLRAGAPNIMGDWRRALSGRLATS